MTHGPEENAEMADIAGGFLRTIMDIISLGTLGAVFIDALPSIAAGLTILWTIIRIWETATFQNWWHKKGG